MYVVRGPFTDGRANYEPVNTRFAGVLAFLFDAGASGAGCRVNKYESNYQGFHV
jgi:hypothetical protein